MIALLLLFFVALGAGVLSGVVGTGSSLIMLPVLVATYGPRIAVPVMAIASLFGNIGRVIVWWHEIRWDRCLPIRWREFLRLFSGRTRYLRFLLAQWRYSWQLSSLR